MLRRTDSTCAVIASALAALALLAGSCRDDPTAVAPQNEGPVYWMPYGQALERAQRENKPLMVFFYTQWCGWSSRMVQETFADSAVVQYLRPNFVAVHIDAESAVPIAVRGGTTNGRLLAYDFDVNVYPTTWFLSASGDRIDHIVGYTAPEPFLETLIVIHDPPGP